MATSHGATLTGSPCSVVIQLIPINSNEEVIEVSHTVLGRYERQHQLSMEVVKSYRKSYSETHTLGDIKFITLNDIHVMYNSTFKFHLIPKTASGRKISRTHTVAGLNEKSAFELLMEVIKSSRKSYTETHTLGSIKTRY